MDLNDLCHETQETIIPMTKHIKPNPRPKNENGPITKAPSKVVKLVNSIKNKQASSENEPMDMDNMQNDEPNELNTNNNIKSKPKTRKRRTSRTTSRTRRRKRRNSNSNNNNKSKSKTRQRTPPNTNSNQREYRSWSTFQESTYSITIHNNMTKKEAKKLIDNSFDSKTNLKKLCKIYNTYAKSPAGKKDGYERIQWSKITVDDIITIAETVLCMYCGNDSEQFCTHGCSMCPGWVHMKCVIADDDGQEINWDNYLCANCESI